MIINKKMIADKSIIIKENSEAAQLSRLGIYVHIPFCLAKCKYCGFYSHEGSTEKQRRAYIESLKEDILEYGKIYGKNRVADTIFIGGGTPSILDEGEISSLLAAIRQAFTVTSDAEISIESNPKTLTQAKLLEYKEAGVNRLSIGVQSLNPEILKVLGRVHSPEDFYQNFQLARKCGFDNINVDLMFAVPGHTMEIWEDTLEKILGLGPEHISFYSLQIEEGTPFYRMYASGELEQISDEVDRAMYHRAIELFKNAGYEHYEISNACRPGRECRHNLKYWSLEEYLGIGRGASSYMEGIRFSEEPIYEFHQNSSFDNMSEYVFTGLRRTEGIELEDFRKRFGLELWDAFGDRREALEEFFCEGFLVESEGRLYLSEKGLDVSNAVMAEFV